MMQAVLTGPFLELVWRTTTARCIAITCVALALIAAAAEIAVALCLLPILTSLGVGAGTELADLINRIPPSAWLVLFAFAAIVRSTVNWWSSVQDERGTQELVVSLQSRLYRALAAAHWDAVRRLSPPSITSALQTQTYDAGYGFSSMLQVMTAALLIIGYLISTIAIFPIMLPVILILLAVMWSINVRRNRSVLVQAEDYHESQTDLHQRYEDWVAISHIASLGVDTERLSSRFESDARSAASHSIGFSRSYASTRASYEIALILAILVGVPVAWWTDSPPALLAFGLVALVRVLPQAGSIHVGYQGVVNAVAPIRAIDKLVSQLEKDPARRSPYSERLTWKKIELSGVGIEDNVRHEEQQQILQNISLTLAHGEWLGLTGPTGAGKTTLADIMLMLLRPTSGEIRVDGQVVDEGLASRWRDQAAYVPQDVVLFDASIRDNLRLYVPDAADAELEAALRHAAGEFVFDRLPEGLDTRVGPGGRLLSGGERQRIGIARALLRKPGFLVLDEPTAALDEDTQAKLMDALANLEHTMSVLLITHRPELIKLTDRLVEIRDGELRYIGRDRRRL